MALSQRAVSHAQQGSVVLMGTVSDAASGAAVPDAVVTVTSPALQGEELAVTDALGAFRVAALPPGLYVLRVERAGYRPYAREALDLHADTTIRVNAGLLPEALKAEEVVVVGRTPTVDVGSSATGLNITSDLTDRVPLSAPFAKGAAARSFESVADVVPGTQSDPFGVSVSGASSPENRYLLDGLSVNNPVYGVLGTPLSIEFIKEVSVLSGGYMPEYGRATGGILNAITKSGSNEYHGSVFSSWAPGALAGDRKTVRRAGQTIVTEPRLAYLGDLGGDVGGPIVRDKLWFYAGFDWSRTSYDLVRSLHATQLDEQGMPLPDGRGGALTTPIPGTRQTFEARQDMLQGLGKLTWAVNGKNRVTLSLNGVHPISGGHGRYGINPLSGLPEIGTESTSFATPLNGPYEALAHRYPGSSVNALARWTSELDGDRLLLDTSLGVHHETGGRLPSDGSRVGSSRGLAGVPNVWWLRSTPPHDISDFERVPGGACDVPGSCPVSDYHTGGPEYLSDQRTLRVSGRSMLTYLFRALGRHVLKVGLDLEYQSYRHDKAYGGLRDWSEAPDGSTFDETRVFGYLTAPDQPVVLASIQNHTTSFTVGGFVQDSWSVLDRVTVNLGLRYDAQLLYAGDGQLAMALPNQWSPRAGILWDPTNEGRAKLFGSFARYYQSVPLMMLDRYLTGEPLLFASHDAGMCNPLDPAQQATACQSAGSFVPIGTRPNANYVVVGAGETPVDPKIKPPSSDEIVLGGEYEIVRDGRLGLTYTRRWLNRTIEDMSRDEAQTFFFGNPGEGIARDFPRTERKYDALTLSFSKLSSLGWVGQASYTLSWLRGNYAGLFRPEDLALEPHQSSDFDLRSLFVNRKGYLPGDRRHAFKLFGAYEIALSRASRLTPGGSFRAYSGEPSSHLAAHPLYGPDQVYVLPRGSAGRLPWTVSLDLRLAYSFDMGRGRGFAITADVFNVLNLQRETVRDQRYTNSSLSPVTNGTLADARGEDGAPLDAAAVNPNFGRPVAYQPPRIFRFGVKGTF